MSPNTYRRRRFPARLGWFIVAVAILGALYIFKRESFWGIVAVFACPLSVIAAVVASAKSNSNPRKKRRKQWTPSGQTDKEWREENRLE